MATAKKKTLYKYKQQTYHEKPRKYERKIISRALRHWAKIKVKGDEDMYEGQYYSLILRINELRKNSDINKDEIEQLENLLSIVQPTDCRGDYCG